MTKPKMKVVILVQYNPVDKTEIIPGNPVETNSITKSKRKYVRKTTSEDAVKVNCSFQEPSKHFLKKASAEKFRVIETT